jgi:sarcosine oxidase delta subunit
MKVLSDVKLLLSAQDSSVCFLACSNLKDPQSLLISFLVSYQDLDGQNRCIASYLYQSRLNPRPTKLESILHHDGLYAFVAVEPRQATHECIICYVIEPWHHYTNCINIHCG